MSDNRTSADFTVRGIPKAQPRPRAFSVGGHARLYDAGTAEAWKADIVRDGRPFRPAIPWEHALAMTLVFWLHRPKRLMRAKDPEGAIYCTAKPDCDNLAKAALDCLKQNGWFRDDSQVVSLDVRKLYHSKTGSPGARITISAQAERNMGDAW